MQIRIFSIPIGACEAQLEEMNHFLRANKIIDIKKELAVLDGNSCRTFCVTYMLANRPADSEAGKLIVSGRQYHCTWYRYSAIGNYDISGDVLKV